MCSLPPVDPKYMRPNSGGKHGTIFSSSSSARTTTTATSTKQQPTTPPSSSRKSVSRSLAASSSPNPVTPPQQLSQEQNKKSVSKRSSSSTYKNHDLTSSRLQTIVLINRTIKFAAHSIKRLHELSTVTSSWRECITDYTAGTWKIAVDAQNRKAKLALEKNVASSSALSSIPLSSSSSFKQFEHLVKKNFISNTSTHSNSVGLAKPDLTWLVKNLLASKAIDPKVTTHSTTGTALSFSCLHHAVLHKSTSLCQLLFELCPASINANQPFTTNFSSRSPVIVAAQNSDNEMARLLLENGAIVDDTIYGRSTPLHIAAATNNLELAQMLLDPKYNCNVNVQDAHGELTPLMVAVMANHTKMVALICTMALDRIDFGLKCKHVYGGCDVVSMLRKREKVSSVADEAVTKMKKYLKSMMREKSKKKQDDEA